MLISNFIQLTPSASLLSRLPIQVDAVVRVASPFDDATHDVYQLQAKEGLFALKLLKNQPSPFWQGLASLFDVHLSQQISHAVEHYLCAANCFSLVIPRLIAFDVATEDYPAYLLTNWLTAESIDSLSISVSLIESLAVADAQRHEQKRLTWGRAVEPSYTLEDWQRRISSLLPHLTAKELEELLNTDGFVPMILDMRWDQCLQQEGRISALLDVDALVFAPRAFELVLMEYWLTVDQLTIWRDVYIANGGDDLPRLSKVRFIYRRLLWSWQVFGRISEAEWMAWPEFFA
jgi:hypothetical protein